jgi:hypothetical protein
MSKGETHSPSVKLRVHYHGVSIPHGKRRFVVFAPANWTIAELKEEIRIQYANIYSNDSYEQSGDEWDEEESW